MADAGSKHEQPCPRTQAPAGYWWDPWTSHARLIWERGRNADSQPRPRLTCSEAGGWGPQSPLQEWDVPRGLRTTALTDPGYLSCRPFPPALRGWTGVAGSSSGLLWGTGSVSAGHCPGLRWFLFSVFGDCDQPRLSSQLASQGCAPIFLGLSSTDLLLSLGFSAPGVSTMLRSNRRTWVKPPCTDVSFGLPVPAPTGVSASTPSLRFSTRPTRSPHTCLLDPQSRIRCRHFPRMGIQGQRG